MAPGALDGRPLAGAAGGRSSPRSSTRCDTLTEADGLLVLLFWALPDDWPVLSDGENVLAER